MTIIALILKTAFGILLVSLVARFLAQIARANFSNPLAQTVVKITDPFVKPMRRIIPGLGGLDIASLVLIFIGQALLATALLAVSSINPLDYLAQIMIWSTIAVAALILTVIQFSMVIVGVFSFILMGQYNPVVGFIGQIIEPFVGPFRKLNLQIGMLDLSFLLAFFVIIVIKDVILIQGIADYVGYKTNYSFFIGL